MIQDFKTYIGEGTLWGNTILRSDTGLVRKEDEITKDMVKSYCDNGFCNIPLSYITIRKENGIQVVDIQGNVRLRGDITELPFQFGKVTGVFSVYGCGKLTSLKGCPREVGGNFNCTHCDSLTSLEGAPEYVGGDFYCRYCGKKFETNEVTNICKIIKGGIYVN